ncbi:hypothetical protein ACRAWD_19765 [Caulobacter segnis]
MRYAIPDDFGSPQTAFNICTFWLIEALHLAGRTEEARELFEDMLSRRTGAGLLSGDIGFADGELWGNYPQTLFPGRTDQLRGAAEPTVDVCALRRTPVTSLLRIEQILKSPRYNARATAPLGRFEIGEALW